MDIAEIEKLPVFFIIGRPRSGTTLIRILFDAHPQVHIPLECQIIPDLYPYFGKKTNWAKKDILNFYHKVVNSPLFGHWNIDLDYLKNTLLEFQGNHKYQTLCKVVYLCYQSFFRKIRY